MERNEKWKSNINECCIHDDVLFEILMRISAQDVFEFILVSKQWYGLISSSHFRRANLLVHIQSYMPELILSGQRDYTSFNMKTRDYRKLSLRSFLNKDARVLDSLDGLVLFKAGRQIYICNPLTRRLQLLLSMPVDWHDKSHSFKLMFDKESKKYMMTGFCYGVDSYCVVTIKGDECKRRQEVLENNVRWLKVEAYNGLDEVLSMDGVLHWIARDGDSLCIRTMDVMKSEIKEKIELPYKMMTRLGDPYRKFNLSTENVENGVSLILSPRFNEKRIEVWVLSKDSNDNSKRTKLIKQCEFDSQVYKKGVKLNGDGVHFIRGNDKKENIIFFVRTHYLFSYDLSTREITKMKVHGHSSNLKYFPSLISWDR